MYKGNLASLDGDHMLSPALRNIIKQAKYQLEQSIENGRYLIKGEDVFFFVVDDNTEALQARKAEMHKKYIDVQILLEGEERFGFSVHPFLSINQNFLEERDIAFGEEIINEQYIDLKKDDYVIFNTEQPHRPLISVNRPMSVRKAVIKISRTWLETQ
ncbi:YhcH/YjgK/YiaL family protein [Vibrio natriegens]|uniref:YhcH/YjgK/YiaL family protein n=1 Tax=Vibrio natriegens TaxID=691 RepID=UPI003DA05ADD